MKRNDLGRFLIILVVAQKNNGIFAKYNDNSEFDLNPFVDPIDLSSSLGLNGPKATLNLAPLINNNDMDLNNLNRGGGGFLEDISTVTPKRSDVEVSYDVQANQLLEYLNSASASLFSLNNVNSNNNYINKPIAIVDSSGFPQQAINNKTNNLAIIKNNSDMNDVLRRKLNSILGEINGTFKISLDADRKEFKFDKSGKPIECFNCSDIKSFSECKEMQDLEYYELVNLFCCQCNADIKEKSSLESIFQNLIRQAKDNSLFRWNFILILITMITIVLIILAIVLSICIYRLMRGKRRKKATSRWSGGGGAAAGGNQDEETSSSSGSSSSSDVNVSRRTTEKDDTTNKVETQINGPKTSENTYNNKTLELNEKASVHSTISGDSLDASTFSNQQGSSLTQEFPSEATTRRYVNLKSGGKTPVIEDKEAPKKDATKVHHQGCKFSGFNIKKTSK